MSKNACEAILHKASSMSDVGSDGAKKSALVEIANRVSPNVPITENLLRDVVKRVCHSDQLPLTADTCVAWAAYINSVGQ